jgi:hypothetical protein
VNAEHYRSLWDEQLRSHKWIVCADAAAGFTPLMDVFVELKAPRPLLLAGVEGTGSLPDNDVCETIIIGTHSDTMLGGIRAFHNALRNLPAEIVDRINEWDPDHEAVVMSSFLDTASHVAGRKPWGARPEAWLALEDKMVVDAIWDAAGITREPMEIVGTSTAELQAASNRIDQGAGVVWTADNRDGWHGGAEYTRFVADPSDAAEASAFMAEHANRVRVMPFLEGVPCAIHGMVFPEHVATFRPVEMVVFRQPGSQKFRYGSCSTSWDPPMQRRDEMREVARIVGSFLREHHDFVGAMTIDGVLTVDGFRPTELNPRYGAGIAALARAADMPLLGFTRMLIEDQADELDGVAIERIVTDASDATRILGGFTFTDGSVNHTEEFRVLWDGSTVTQCEPDVANATLTRGPAAHGVMIRFTLDANAVPVGSMAAPIVAQGMAAADRIWDAGIGDLTAATEV